MSQCDLAAGTTSACLAIQRDIFWAFTIIEKDKNCSSLSSYFQAIWLSYPSGFAHSSIEYLWNIRHFKACWAVYVHGALRKNILLQLDHMFTELVVNLHKPTLTQHTSGTLKHLDNECQYVTSRWNADTESPSQGFSPQNCSGNPKIDIFFRKSCISNHAISTQLRCRADTKGWFAGSFRIFVSLNACF